MKFPGFDQNGDLPMGVHQATIDETLKHFERGAAKRRQVAQRLKRIYEMIQNDNELRVTLERIRRMQNQIAELRRKETNPMNYRLSASGYLAEIDRMHYEVREYLLSHPQEAELEHV